MAKRVLKRGLKEGARAASNVVGAPGWERRVIQLEELGARLAGARRAPAEVFDACRDRRMLVKVTAIETLESIRDPKSRRVLQELLRDPNPIVRSYAAEALAAVVGAPARKTLRAALTREKAVCAKIGLWFGLAVLGDGESIASLTRAAATARSAHTRRAAVNALGDSSLMRSQATEVLDMLNAARGQDHTVLWRSTVDAAVAKIEKRLRD